MATIERTHGVSRGRLLRKASFKYRRMDIHPGSISADSECAALSLAILGQSLRVSKYAPPQWRNSSIWSDVSSRLGSREFDFTLRWKHAEWDARMYSSFTSAGITDTETWRKYRPHESIGYDPGRFTDSVHHDLQISTKQTSPAPPSSRAFQKLMQWAQYQTHSSQRNPVHKSQILPHHPPPTSAQHPPLPLPPPLPRAIHPPLFTALYVSAFPDRLPPIPPVSLTETPSQPSCLEVRAPTPNSLGPAQSRISPYMPGARAHVGTQMKCRLYALAMGILTA